MSVIKVAELSAYHKYFKWDFIYQEDFNIEIYIKSRQWVYDCDNCGDRVSFYVTTQDGNFRFYKVKHEWWWDNYNKDDSTLINEFEITEVNKSDLNEDASKNLRFVV